MNVDQTEATFIANVVTCILNSLLSPIKRAGNFIIVYVIWKFFVIFHCELELCGLQKTQVYPENKRLLICK